MATVLVWHATCSEHCRSVHTAHPQMISRIMYAMTMRTELKAGITADNWAGQARQAPYRWLEPCYQVRASCSAARALGCLAATTCRQVLMNVVLFAHLMHLSLIHI